MIEHVVVLHPDAAGYLPFGKAKARELRDTLTRRGKRIGEKQYTLKDNGRDVYVRVRAQLPNLWIYLDIGKCPSFVSGLFWIKNFLEPTVTEDDVERLRTLFAKDAPTTERDSARLAPVADNLATLRSGMYSGEMRKVVQILLGMGGPIPYDYRASRTHGVFVDAKGTRWVIRISRTGVVAYQMLMCRGKNVPETLGYTPLPTSEPDEPIELLTEAQMEAVLEGKGAFFTQCGWAFSEDGHRAANVFVGSDDRYSYAWQYEIVITEDPETGAPTSATVSARNEGRIHGPKTTHMKYPRRDGFLLYSFDPYRGNASYTDESRAPVYCYYEGSTLKTFFYTYDPSVYSSSYGSPDPYGGKSSFCMEFLGTMRDQGSLSRTGIPVINTTGAFEYKTTDSSRTVARTDLGYVGFTTPTNVTSIFIEYHLWSTETYDRSGVVTEDKTCVLIVPQHEREAAYIAEKSNDDAGGYDYARTDRLWEYRYLDSQQVEDCPVPFGTGTVYQATNVAGLGFIDSSCDLGRRMVSVDDEVFVFPQTIGPGAIVRDYESQPVNGVCPAIPGKHFVGETSYGTTTVARSTEVNYKLQLYRSNASPRAIGVDDEEIEYWLRFIEGVADQAALVERDAFSDRMFYTTRINMVQGYQTAAVDESPYDRSLIRGSKFGFVGIP